MDKNEFSKIRRTLGKTQKKFAQLLCISVKAIQSFEQGWREIPPHIERQVLFLYIMSRDRETPDAICWEVMQCPAKKRQECPAWEFQCGHLCWFISGTICNGEAQKNWHEKMKICRTCNVLQDRLKLD